MVICQALAYVLCAVSFGFYHRSTTLHFVVGTPKRGRLGDAPLSVQPHIITQRAQTQPRSSPLVCLITSTWDGSEHGAQTG